MILLLEVSDTLLAYPAVETYDRRAYLRVIARGNPPQPCPETDPSCWILDADNLDDLGDIPESSGQFDFSAKPVAMQVKVCARDAAGNPSTEVCSFSPEVYKVFGPVAQWALHPTWGGRRHLLFSFDVWHGEFGVLRKDYPTTPDYDHAGSDMVISGVSRNSNLTWNIPNRAVLAPDYGYVGYANVTLLGGCYLILQHGWHSSHRTYWDTGHGQRYLNNDTEDFQTERLYTYYAHLKNPTTMWYPGQNIITNGNPAHCINMMPGRQIQFGYQWIPIRMGQWLGLIGNTGLTPNDTPHLHFEIRNFFDINPSMISRTAFDPEMFLVPYTVQTPARPPCDEICGTRSTGDWTCTCPYIAGRPEYQYEYPWCRNLPN